jgi:hypothetical protein
VTFAIRPHRTLRTRELVSIQEAADRYGAFLGLEARVRVDVASD